MGCGTVVKAEALLMRAKSAGICVHAYTLGSFLGCLLYSSLFTCTFEFPSSLLGVLVMFRGSLSLNYLDV